MQNEINRQGVLFLLLFVVLIQADLALSKEIPSFRAQSDQVLVLYNADWPLDADGSYPGQDSIEVAEYYQRQHTDPVTGKKPYLLGLSCIHLGKFHLNKWKLTESSQDNKDGIVYKGEGRGPEASEWARDSRRVEIILGRKNSEIIDWNSVSFVCRSRNGSEKKITDIRISGIPRKKGRRIFYPETEAGKGKCYRFDAHKLFSGTVSIHVSARDKHGGIIKNLTVRYYDRNDFRFSKFGPDGISDERHFIEDVVIPVKEFLEDPDHALPDGTLLRDHILYIVVSHGLPYACEGVFGIERGVTPRPRDHGDLGSLEQRLQTVYYGWGTVIRPPVVSRYMTGGPKSEEGVRNYRITSALRYPLGGRRWNPYMHPDTYSFLGNKKAPEFFFYKSVVEERRNTTPEFFTYGVSRIDGQGPFEARRIIDYAVYASKYLRPEMQTGKKTSDLPERLQKIETQGLSGREEILALGFYSERGSRVEGLPFLVRGHGYYPGGMNRKVVSNNGWNMGRGAPIWNHIDHGVTVSACGGPAYGGGPHITNTTFWDNRILMHYLFRGRDLGECFLRSTYYVNWSTSLVGDPLYHPDLNRTVIDTRPPVTDFNNIRIDPVPTMGHYSAVVSVPVINTPENPEVALLRVFYGKDDSKTQEESSSHIYATTPSVYLRNLEPDTLYSCRLELTDPYGNRNISAPGKGLVTFQTGKHIPEGGIRTKTILGKNKGMELNLLGFDDLKEHGTLTIVFHAGKFGCFPGVSSKEFLVKTKPWAHKKSIRTEFGIGAPQKIIFLHSPLKSGEKAKMIIRWRRFPRTREISLVAANKEEFLLAADTRTPWKNPGLGLSMNITAGSGVKLLSAMLQNDSEPASRNACKIMVPDIDPESWNRANKE